MRISALMSNEEGPAAAEATISEKDPKWTTTDDFWRNEPDSAHLFVPAIR